MLSIEHEVLVALFRNQPLLAAELLAGAPGVVVPEFDEARVESGEFSDVTPAQYRADGVVVLTLAASAVLAVVVEVQLRPDPRKRWTWPEYVMALRARLERPVVLLVMCVDAGVAAWCATPIEVHPGTLFVPVVVGPDRVPVVTDVAQAVRVPELAVLSAMAHGDGPDRGAVLGVVPDALVAAGEHGFLYYDQLLAALSEAARGCLEGLMGTGTKYEFKSDFARNYYSQGEARGEARGEAKAVLTVLDARGVDVPADARARISGCSDLDQLDVWVRRAATAISADELFDH